MMPAQEQLAIIKSNVVDVLPEEELIKKLERSVSTGKPLTIKLGLDPSRPDIHLGHAVVLNKLRQFQDLGHNVVLIIGDFTAMIGDPTGRSKTRTPLTLDDTRANGKTYISQASAILNAERTRVVYNSSWLDKLTFKQIISLTAKYTVAQLLERDDFTKRYRGGEPIGVHEFLYPLSQAYDSVEIEADVELGGTDQKFNLLVGREVMRAYGMEPQCILTMPILEGTDGVEKMSKSLDNYIALLDTPRDMFGKTMSIPDTLIVRYLKYACFADVKEVDDVEKGLSSGTIHPRFAKVDVARRIVARYHGIQAANEAVAEFDRIFVNKDVPDDVPEWNPELGQVTIPIVDLLVITGMTPSKSEARRLIQQGAVQINGAKITDMVFEIDVTTEQLLKVGKLRFLRIVPTAKK